uniref:snRNA-activating protein complex subunit 1 n=1 Tax=Ciona savignyi TaxID=51511 RepID=H2ZI60_CIOSA
MVRHKKSRMLRRFIFPASGLKSDVEDLLHKFVETESLRYEEFSKLWRAANFSLVHAGRAGLREKREFMDEAFKIVLKFTLPPHNLQVRVGAVYTLYALYHTQRQQPKTKVRMPIASWKDLLSLHHELAAQKHYDADYVMRSIMTKDRIFEFVAYPSPLS